MAEPGADVTTARWAQVRALFEAVCDLPPDAGEARLAELTDDVRLREEVMALVGAQTEAFASALQPLHTLVARLDGEELAEGDRIGHWTLRARLGAGGMGAVFVAERDDGLFRQRVALKILRRQADAEAARQLDAERALLAGLVHPGIARLYDGGTTPMGQPFLVMEYVDGVALDRWLAEAAPGLDARLALFDRLCDAVAYAHRQLVVHCDLKPHNVLVRPDGSPVLLDFGIARWAGAASLPASDDAGASDAPRFCTPGYASPEQLQGRTPGVASDVFSLGVILAEMLADAPMGRTASDAAVPTRAPSTFARRAALGWTRELRGDLDAIVAMATALDPAKRYADVGALRADLARRGEHLPTRARPATLPRRARLFLRRYRRGVAVAAGGALLVGAFTVQLAVERDRAREAADTAEATARFLVEAFAAANPRETAAAGKASARDVLDAGAERIATELKDRPAVRAELLLAIGNAYRNLGQDTRAEPMLRQAIDLFTSPDVDRPLQAVRALQDLSTLVGNSGRGQEAVALAERAEALRLAAGDHRPEAIADAQNHLGLAYTAVRDLGRAQAALEAALALRRERIDAAPLEFAVTLNNLARVHRLAERFDQAEAVYFEAMAVAEAQGAQGGPSRQTAMAGIGASRMQAGRTAEAVPWMQASLALAREVYGDDSGHVANAHNEIANALHDLARLAEAEEHYRASVALEADSSGADSLASAIRLNNLAALLEDRGDFAAAEPLARRSLAIREARLPANDVMVLRSRANVARLLTRMGQLDEAGRYLAPLLAHHRAESPADASDRIRTELAHVEWLAAAGRLDEAEAALAAVRVPADAHRMRDRHEWTRRRIGLDEAHGRHAEALARADAFDVELMASGGAAPLQRLRNDAVRARLRAALDPDARVASASSGR
jgi:serine/threonine-protein kinase